MPAVIVHLNPETILNADIDTRSCKYIDNERLVRLIKGLCNGLKMISTVSADEMEVFSPDQ